MKPAPPVTRILMDPACADRRPRPSRSLLCPAGCRSGPEGRAGRPGRGGRTGTAPTVAGSGSAGRAAHAEPRVMAEGGIDARLADRLGDAEAQVADPGLLESQHRHRPV